LSCRFFVAFVNFDNVPSADRAIAEMDGMKDGGWTLKVHGLTPVVFDDHFHRKEILVS